MENKIEINGVTYIRETLQENNSEKDENGNINCKECQDCNNLTWCNNSTECYNSTWCHNSTWCLYCNELMLEKYCIFNKQLNKERYNKLKEKIKSQLGLWKRPEQLTDEDKNWLKENIKEFNSNILDKIISNSQTPDKPRTLD